VKKENLIVNKTFQFSIEMIAYCDLLYQNKKFTIAHQLLKSSTSIGANVMEAQHAESTSDFLHKIKIAMKEANETAYWLNLCEKSKGYTFESKFQENIESIIKILSKIFITTKKIR